MSEIFQNANLTQIIEIVHELNNPKALASANANPIEFFAGFGITLPANAAYEIYLNDNEYFYLVISTPDTIMNDEQLGDIQAGAKFVATVTTGLCLSSISCPFSIASASTVSTISSLDPNEFKNKSVESTHLENISIRKKIFHEHYNE